MNPRGVRREQWDYCSRCNQLYPISQLGKQKGVLMCFDKCMDNLDVERRPQMIASALQNSTEFENEKIKILSIPGELPTF